MKKIGIFTLNGNFNYGNRFQNYATQRYIEQLGYQAETIKYKMNLDKINEDKNLFGKIKSHFYSGDIYSIAKFKLNKLINLKKIKEKNKLLKYREENFKVFSNKYINETEETLDQSVLEDELKQQELNNSYLSFFAGSDQVWNLDNEKAPIFFFMPFIQKEKRNSIAASFGVNKIQEEFITDYSEGIDGMNRISVREDSGKDIVNKLTGRDSLVILDPTFLLSTTEWIDIAKDGGYIPKEKYILTYFIGEMTKEYKKTLELIADREKLKIINLNNINEPGYFVIAPDIFLSLVKNAEFIFTDSFHGVAFSIIFKKPFMSVDRVDVHKNMNTRIISVLSKFDLIERHNMKNIDNVMEIDYSNADSIIDSNKELTRSFIIDSLRDVCEKDG